MYQSRLGGQVVIKALSSGVGIEVRVVCVSNVFSAFDGVPVPFVVLEGLMVHNGTAEFGDESNPG